MKVEVGDGRNTLFSSDRWIHGQRIADIALRLIAAVPKKIIKRCTVHEALTERKWVSDIRGALTVGVILEFLHLWEILSNFELQSEENDTHFWRFAANGQYSTKVAEESFLLGSIIFEPFDRI
jgi:hypothetical protein